MIIDGKREAKVLRDQIKKEISVLKSKSSKIPNLTVILVGKFVPSEIYVKNKVKMSEEVGINSNVINLNSNSEYSSIISRIVLSWSKM